MVRNRCHLSIWAAVVFAAGGLLCAAQTPSADNSPIFSKPTGDGIANAASSDELPAVLSAEPGGQPFLNSESGPLPTPTPDINPALQKQQQALSEWPLMTPEEIMGLQSPRQMFGLPEEDENLSPEERFLKREEKAKNSLSENSLAQPGSTAHDFEFRFDRPDSATSKLAPGEQDDPGAFTHMFNNAEASPFASKDRLLSAIKPGGPDTDQADQEQAADMARFRGLIGETPQTPDQAPSPPLKPADSGLESPSPFDEFGRPEAPRFVDPSKPEGLTLPPEFVEDSTPAQKPKKPSWEPQPAPWTLGNMNAPGTPPVRKFY